MSKWTKVYCLLQCIDDSFLPFLVYLQNQQSKSVIGQLWHHGDSNPTLSIMQEKFQMKESVIYTREISSRKCSFSFPVLMAGAPISKVLLVVKHMGLGVYESRTFFYHQSRFLFPIILKYWETYLVSLVTKIKGMKDAVWSGDGRFDSMGHSAKFGAYTLLCSPVMKIVHFELLQVIVIQKYWVFHFNSFMIFSEHTIFTKCTRFSTWKSHLHFCPKTTTKCSKLWTVQVLELLMRCFYKIHGSCP